MGVETNSGGAEESELAAPPPSANDKAELVRRGGRKTKVTTTETEYPEEELVSVIVAPGRSVLDGEAIHGPGTQILVSAADAVMLAKAGHAKPPGKADDARLQTGPKVRDDTK